MLSNFKNQCLIIGLLSPILLSCSSSVEDVGGDKSPPWTTVTPDENYFCCEQQVTLSCQDNKLCEATYYTIDGTLPEQHLKNRYIGPITITTKSPQTTLNYFSIDASGNIESTQTKNFRVDKTSPELNINPDGGVYANALQVEIACTDSEAGCKSIFYTIADVQENKSNLPIENYIESTNIPVNVTIRIASKLLFFAKDRAGNESLINESIFTFDNTPPQPVSNIQTKAGILNVKLEWLNPTDSDFDKVIIKKSTQPMTNSTMGELIYEGSVPNYMDTQITDSKRVYYRLYSYDIAGNEMPSEEVSVVPISIVTSPANTDIAVGLNSAISATFPTAIEIDGINLHSRNSMISGNTSINPSLNQIKLTPSGPLNLLTPYEGNVTVNLIDSLGYSFIDEFSWQFLTRDGQWDNLVATQLDEVANGSGYYDTFHYKIYKTWSSNLPDGQIFLVWSQFQSSSSFSGDMAVFAARFMPNIGWSNIQKITSGSPEHFDIVSNDAGDLFITVLNYNTTPNHMSIHIHKANDSWDRWVPRNVTNNSGINISLPKIRINNQGDALYVWREQDLSDNRFKIWYLYYDATTGWVNQNPVIFNLEDTFSSNIQLEENGDAYYFWPSVDKTTNSNVVQAMKYSKQLGWSANIKKVTPDGLDVSLPEIYKDKNGNFILNNIASGKNGGWWVNKLDPSAFDSWDSSNFQIIESAGTIYNVNSVVGEGGNIITYWFEGQGISNTNIYDQIVVKQYDGSTGQVSLPTVLNTLKGKVIYASSVVDKAGIVYVLWMQRDENDFYIMYISRFNANTGWEQPKILHRTNQINQGIVLKKLFVNQFAGIFICGIDNTVIDTNVTENYWMAKIDANMPWEDVNESLVKDLTESQLVTKFNPNTFVETKQNYSPYVSFDDVGNTMILWSKKRNIDSTEVDIWAIRYALNENWKTWDSTGGTKIEFNGTGNPVEGLELFTQPSGEMQLIWHQSDAISRPRYWARSFE